MSRSESVRVFAAFPDRLAAAARAAAGRPVPLGEWGPTEVVRHLIAVEDQVWHVRFGQLAAGERPRWSWTEPGQAAGYDDAPLEAVIAAFAAERAITVATIRALDDDGWARSGTHETYGVLDAAGLLQLANDHGDEHLAGLAAG
jgi:hypothetical protein